MKTLNQDFMKSSISDARKGLLTLTKTTLSPGIVMYRFGDTRYLDRIYTGPWWIDPKTD